MSKAQPIHHLPMAGSKVELGDRAWVAFEDEPRFGLAHWKCFEGGAHAKRPFRLSQDLRWKHLEAEVLAYQDRGHKKGSRAFSAVPTGTMRRTEDDGSGSIQTCVAFDLDNKEGARSDGAAAVERLKAAIEAGALALARLPRFFVTPSPSGRGLRLVVPLSRSFEVPATAEGRDQFKAAYGWACAQLEGVLGEALGAAVHEAPEGGKFAIDLAANQTKHLFYLPNQTHAGAWARVEGRLALDTDAFLAAGAIALYTAERNRGDNLAAPARRRKARRRILPDAPASGRFANTLAALRVTVPGQGHRHQWRLAQSQLLTRFFAPADVAHLVALASEDEIDALKALDTTVERLVNGRKTIGRPWLLRNYGPEPMMRLAAGLAEDFNRSKVELTLKLEREWLEPGRNRFARAAWSAKQVAERVSSDKGLSSALSVACCGRATNEAVLLTGERKAARVVCKNRSCPGCSLARTYRDRLLARQEWANAPDYVHYAKFGPYDCEDDARELRLALREELDSKAALLYARGLEDGKLYAFAVAWDPTGFKPDANYRCAEWGVMHKHKAIDELLYAQLTISVHLAQLLAHGDKEEWVRQVERWHGTHRVVRTNRPTTPPWPKAKAKLADDEVADDEVECYDVFETVSGRTLAKGLTYPASITQAAELLLAHGLASPDSAERAIQAMTPEELAELRARLRPRRKRQRGQRPAAALVPG